MSTFSYIPSSRPVPFGEPLGSSLALPTPMEGEMVGDSAAMKRLRLQIRRIGPHFRTVLVTGESGAGKEMAARALHWMSAGVDGAFVVSAAGNRIDSLVKMTRGGTLFFDGIEEMPLATQDEFVEILRRNEWAQEGLAAPQKMNARIIASTNQDLRTLATSGKFRQELYQRIAMVQIGVAPLRERMEDVPELATHFVKRSAQAQGKSIRTIAQDAMERLQSHEWPGNIRELEDVIDEAVSKCEGSALEAWQLPELAMTLPVKPSMDFDCGERPARLQDVVEQHVLHVLKNCAGNKLRAAELLGISRSTLYRMLDACSAGGTGSRSYTDQ
jgi:DNA-binding NtrC family response regulator